MSTSVTSTRLRVVLWMVTIQATCPIHRRAETSPSTGSRARGPTGSGPALGLRPTIVGRDLFSDTSAAIPALRSRIRLVPTLSAVSKGPGEILSFSRGSRVDCTRLGFGSSGAALRVPTHDHPCDPCDPQSAIHDAREHQRSRGQAAGAPRTAGAPDALKVPLAVLCGRT